MRPVDNADHFLPRTQESKERIQKTQEFEHRGSVLRNERRRRTVDAVGMAEPVRAELDLAVVEEEVRGVNEAIIGNRIVELVARAIHVQLLPTDKPIGVGQNDGADSERAETELVRVEALACPTDRTTTVTYAELTCHDEDVTGLMLGDQIERVRRTSVNSQTIRRDLSVAPVVELARSGDLLVDEPDTGAVALGIVLDLREELLQTVTGGNGEPPLGSGRKFRQVLRVLERLRRIETHDLGECRDLVPDRLGAVVLVRVGEVGPHLLILELVVDRQLSESENGGFADTHGELGVAVHTLSTVLAEVCVVPYRLFGGVGGYAGDLLDLSIGCGLLSKRRHDVSSFCLLGIYRSTLRLD